MHLMILWLAHSRKAVALEKCNHHNETAFYKHCYCCCFVYRKQNSSTLEEVNAFNNDLMVKEGCGFTTLRLELFTNTVTDVVVVVVVFTENRTLQH